VRYIQQLTAFSPFKYIDLEGTVLRKGRSKIGLFVFGLFWLGISLSQAFAEEVGVHYQVLGTQQANGSTTVSIILELMNLSGQDLNNLTIGQSITPLALPDDGSLNINIGTLTPTEPKMIQASFTVPNADMASGDEPFKFYVTYNTADGIPRAALLLGQPTAFIGNPIP
jgi:hypothetical protein